METRFHLFEHLFLPSIAAQIDKDFRLIVLSSACMPAPYQARLSVLCKTVEQIELVFSESEGLQNATRPYAIPQSLKGDSSASTMTMPCRTPISNACAPGRRC